MIIDAIIFILCDAFGRDIKSFIFVVFYNGIFCKDSSFLKGSEPLKNNDRAGLLYSAASEL
jgi:hypothetical protein